MNPLRPRYSISGLLLLILVGAVSIAAYRAYYVPPLDRISGLELLQKTSQRQDVAFLPDATRRTAAHLIAQLSEPQSLWFYDSKYDSPSDPGAFIEIMQFRGEYVVALSNHGWSTDWFVVSTDEAIELLWACRHMNGPDRSESLLDEGMRLYDDAGTPKEVNRDPDYPAAIWVRKRIQD